MNPTPQIVLATDFSEGAESAIDVAARMAAAWGAKITLVHVYELPLDFGMPTALLSSELIEQSMARAAEVALQEVTQRLTVRGVAAGFLLRVGSASQKIQNVAAEVGADLIVVGMHGMRGRSNLIGSVAERVIRTATRPVMVVPTLPPNHLLSRRALDAP